MAAERKKTTSKKKKKLFRPPAFDDLSDKELALFYNISRIRKYDAGAVIISEGDTTRSFFVILQGSVNIARNFDGVDKQIDTFRKGSLVGEIAFVRKTARVATVTAAEPSALIEISTEAFDSLPVKTQLKIFKNVASIATDRVERLMRHSAETVSEKDLIYNYISKYQSKTANVLSSGLIQDIIHKIPKLPMYATELTVKLLDEKTTPQDVADSIRSDPSLAGIVMKTVNSPFYNFPQKIADLNRAVVILGFNALFQMIVREGVKNTMPKTEEFEKLQTRSYIMSMIAYEVSNISTREKAGINSTIGILHDIGRSVILLLKRSNPKIAELIDSLDHSKLGAALLKNWELPERLCKVVEYQDYPEFTPPVKIPGELLEELSVLYLSRVCYEHLEEYEETDSASFFHEYASVLNIPRQSPKEFLNKNIIPALMKFENRLPAEIRYKLQREQFSES